MLESTGKHVTWVTGVLWVTGIFALIGGVTGIRRVSMGSELTVEYSTPSGRLLVLAYGVVSVFAAYKCTQRAKAGWWLVATMIATLMSGTVWGMVRVASASGLLAIPWLVQLVLLALLLRWWRRQAIHCFAKSNVDLPSWPTSQSRK